MAYPFYPNLYQPQQMAQPQQASGFVSVRSEAEARNYPVAFGNSVTMKDENAPYIYTKTMGFSQLDRPIFDKYKLIKEEESIETIIPPEKTDSRLEDIKAEIGRLWKAVDDLKQKEDEEGV